MIANELFRLLAYLWAAFGVYWMGAGLLKRAPSHGKSSQSGEFRLYRPLRLIILAVTFSLLFWGQTAVGFLGRRFAPVSSPLAITGFAAALLGLGIAVWARVHLGRFWSDKVVLQADHQLVRSGPYAYMRHPIYSGVLLGVAGTAVVLDEIRGMVAFCLLLANYVIKARREEKILAQQFGEEFSFHRRQAGFLLPKLH
jgi:protein-S-isoprenylcysteine O-methyltransferase Ste14